MDLRSRNPTRSKFPASSTLVIGLLAVLMACCWQKDGAKPLPRPKAALRPVGVGVLVQLKAALDFMRRVEMTQPEELDNLPLLTHALATFYGWPDPSESVEEMYAFLNKLCARRVGRPDRCGRLAWAMEATRRALLDDLISVSDSFLETGVEKAGTRSVRGLRKDFLTKRRKLDQRLAAIRARWPMERLPEVNYCRTDDVKAMVVEVNRRGVWVNGMAVLALDKGKLPAQKDALEGLQTLMVAGAAFGSSGRSGRIPEGDKKKGGSSGGDRMFRGFIFRISSDLKSETVAALLRLSGDVQLTRVFLRARRARGMEVVCWLPIRVDRTPFRPPGLLLRIGSSGVEISAPGSDRIKTVPLKEAALRRELGAELKKGQKSVTTFGKVPVEKLVRVFEIIARNRPGHPVRVWFDYSKGRSVTAAARSGHAGGRRPRLSP